MDTPLYRFRGKVKPGAKRGKLLGFPTANMSLRQQIPEGVYASEVTIGGRNHHAATFVGSAKTYGDMEYKAECFILDFHSDLYGKWVTVYLHKKLRGSKKFSSQELLIAQIKRDVLQTRAFFCTF